MDINGTIADGLNNTQEVYVNVLKKEKINDEENIKKNSNKKDKNKHNSSK